MTSIRKGTLPFSGWPRSFAASSLLCRQRQGRGRERGLVAHNSLIGHQRVWSGQELTVRGQGIAEALVLSDKGPKKFFDVGMHIALVTFVNLYSEDPTLQGPTK